MILFKILNHNQTNKKNFFSPVNGSCLRKKGTKPRVKNRWKWWQAGPGRRGGNKIKKNRETYFFPESARVNTLALSKR